MELTIPPSTATTTVGDEVTAVTARAVASAATTVVTAVGRLGSRDNARRMVNVHGRLMYDEIVINDVWINAILSTLAFTCAACVCVCFLYCKFQQWKIAAQLRRDEKNSRKHDNESLPSYTIVTGLPSYDEALERMKNAPPPPPPITAIAATAKPATATATTMQMQVYVKDERRTTSSKTAASHCPATEAAPAKKFGLVSHTLVPGHDGGCSHCLSVQELLETYNVR